MYYKGKATDKLVFMHQGANLMTDRLIAFLLIKYQPLTK